MKANAFRHFLCRQAAFFFRSRHSANPTVQRNARDMLASFFAHGRAQRAWRNGTL